MFDAAISGLSLADAFLALPLLAIAGLLVLGPVRDSQWKSRIADGEPKARLKLYAETMSVMWIGAFVCMAGWVLSGRSLAELGFDATHGGWRGGVVWGGAIAATLYMAWSVFETARSRKARASLRRQLDAMDGLDMIRARTPAEHNRFLGVALTAGITEEIIFRGFLIGTLALVMPLWAAAALSVAAFTLAHLYQGLGGLLRVLPLGILLTIIYLIGGSLWPVMIIHAAVDLMSGAMFRLIDRHAKEDAESGAAAS